VGRIESAAQECMSSPSAVTATWLSLATAIQGELRQRQVHPARAVVVLPFAQLLPLAQQAWGALAPSGFAPRFETTRTWAQSLPSGLDAAPRSDDAAHAANATEAAADISFRQDTAHDWLTAAQLLRQAGLGRASGSVVGFIPKLLQATQQLSSVCAAQPPSARAEWVASARALLQSTAPQNPLLGIEAALCRIALEWAASSRFASDALWLAAAPQTEQTVGAVQCVIVLQGLPGDLWALGLKAHWGDACVVLNLMDADAQHLAPAPAALPVQHPCASLEDEVQRTAACVLAHVQAGRTPVALAATDRSLTRRVRALLAAQGAVVQDETGWKLSTTHAAAQVMALLRASSPRASADEVLDALKNSPALPLAALGRIESAWRRLRGANLASLCQTQNPTRQSPPSAPQNHAQSDAPQPREPRTALPPAERDRLQAWLNDLAALQRTQSLAQHLATLHGLLHRTGLHERLSSDEAGQQVLKVLSLADSLPTQGLAEDGFSSMATTPTPLPATATTASLGYSPLWALRAQDFVQWLDSVLDSHSFKPALSAAPSATTATTGEADVLILPLHQMLGRRFAALVMPGCDEMSLPAAPEPEGLWLPAQRAALGLPTRDSLAAAQRAALHAALPCAPQVDCLWREHDGAEARNLSPLLQLWWLDQAERSTGLSRSPQGVKKDAAAFNRPDDSEPQAPTASPLFTERRLPVQSTPAPAPHFGARALPTLTASAYEGLRRCPYQFFALHGLGLREPNELESELEKSDFGTWLHEVLKDFHVQRQAAQASSPSAANDAPSIEAALEQSADRVSQALGVKLGLELGAAADGAFAAAPSAYAAQFLPYALQWPGMRHAYAQWLLAHEAAGHQFLLAEQSLRATLHLPLPLTGEGGQAAAVLIAVKGRVDRVDTCANGDRLILDYKTGSRDSIQKRVKDPLEDVQLAFYAELLEASDAMPTPVPAQSTESVYLSLLERTQADQPKDAPTVFKIEDFVATRAALRDGLAQDWSRLRAGAALKALGEGTACERCDARGLCRKDWRNNNEHAHEAAT
jgi:ATP-dependent helicase/nuclease subunit B